MRITTTSLSSLLATVALGWASFPVSAAAKDCGLKQYGSIDLVVGKEARTGNDLLVGKEYFVPVTIDGHSGLMSFALNTGISLFHEGAVESLSLKTKRAGVTAAAGDTKLNRLAQFKSLALGDVTFGKGGFLVHPGQPAPEGPDGKPVFGILGTEALTIVDFELDLSRRKLNLFSQDHCKGEVVYWAKDWGTAPFYIGPYRTLYFPLELEGRKIEATFAPGSAASMLSVDVTKRVYGFDKDSPGVQTVPYEGDTLAHFQAMQLTARGMTFNNSPVRLRDSPNASDAIVSCKLELRSQESGAVGYSGCENRYPMALGGNVLEKMRIYFATKERKIYFTLADGSVNGPSPAPLPKK
jgi:hypothetical protein